MEGLGPRGLKADGGAARNGFLIQLVADLCGVEIGVAAMSECSPLGATLAGMLGMGLVVSLGEFAGEKADGRRFVPAMELEEVASLRSGWNKALEQTIGEHLARRAYRSGDPKSPASSA